ncbi:DUF7667 family protein [Paenibacillus senegalimassiliensis]|uniref:DUF7667 family protein n=1 Tax=Paenibacillus senegalimassiliensis TaxID=1737426 RepID=UPI00073FA2E1|nr:hypothetical protein [Paenibacillus senegalimassiliensis]
MTIPLNPIHRRLAELTERGIANLNPMEQMDLLHCLDANLRQVRQLHQLNGLITAAQVAGDYYWASELVQRADRVLRGG